MNEQEVRLEVIKCLIHAGITNTLRGDVTDALAFKANPLVAYVMGSAKKPKKASKAEAANSPTSDPAKSSKDAALEPKEK